MEVLAENESLHLNRYGTVHFSSRRFCTTANIRHGDYRHSEERLLATPPENREHNRPVIMKTRGTAILPDELTETPQPHSDTGD